MEWQSSGLNEESTGTPLVTFQEQEEKPNKRLADPITTPRKGPLVLSKLVSKDTHPTTARRSKAHTQYSPRSKERCLNRFPVPSIQRPIDAIESSLGRISLAELKQQAFYVSVTTTHNLSATSNEVAPQLIIKL